MLYLKYCTSFYNDLPETMFHYDTNLVPTSTRSVTDLNTINMRNTERMINCYNNNTSSRDVEEAPDSDVRMLDSRSRTNSYSVYLRILDTVSVSTSELLYSQVSYLETGDKVNGVQSIYQCLMSLHSDLCVLGIYF